MIKKNKLIIFITLLAVITAYVSRVTYINNETLSANKLIYKADDEVPIENNYFNSSDEKMNGYIIKVLDTEIISMENFKAEHSNFVSDLQAENIFLVKILVRNVDSTYGGINFGHYLIQEGSYISFLNRDAYPFVNEFETLTFSLRTDSEMEFVLPFNLDSHYIDFEKFKSGKPTLIVSLYPQKNSIILNL